jgi:hypothetical protein
MWGDAKAEAAAGQVCRTDYGDAVVKEQDLRMEPSFFAW